MNEKTLFCACRNGWVPSNVAAAGTKAPCAYVTCHSETAATSDGSGWSYAAASSPSAASYILQPRSKWHLACRRLRQITTIWHTDQRVCYCDELQTTALLFPSLVAVVCVVLHLRWHSARFGTMQHADMELKWTASHYTASHCWRVHF